MNVDKETFLKDIAKLKALRVIVLDKEVVDNTGVSKTALSTYLNSESTINPSKAFLKKFYEIYGTHLNSNTVNEDATFLISFGFISLV